MVRGAQENSSRFDLLILFFHHFKSPQKRNYFSSLFEAFSSNCYSENEHTNHQKTSTTTTTTTTTNTTTTATTTATTTTTNTATQI